MIWLFKVSKLDLHCQKTFVNYLLRNSELLHAYELSQPSTNQSLVCFSLVVFDNIRNTSALLESDTFEFQNG